MARLTEAEERQIVLNHLQIGLRDLYVRDLFAANAGDVRMGTFVLCASFLDTLSLSYSAGVRDKGKPNAQWNRFVSRYFSDEYAFLRTAYHAFRNRLLHNYSAEGIIFTHGTEYADRHCQVEPDGRVWMHRESFLRDVLAAFAAFEQDVLSDPDLRRRVARHWQDRPPMGLEIRIR